MQRKTSRQLELARRIAVYAVMIATVIALLIIFVLTVTGYRFNFTTKTVEQTGLVQYDSFPRGALVMVDGTNYETTQTKGTVLPGQRQFSMQLKGYENWQKTVEIRSGTVTWLSYARLVPIQKEITTTQTLPKIDDSMTSPDDRYMVAVSTADEQPELYLVDFRDSRRPNVQRKAIDTTGLAGYTQDEPVDEDQPVVTHRFTLKEWSGGSRYILLKHYYTLPDQPEEVEWLWIDRESPEKITNISTLLNLPISDIQLIDGRDAYILQHNGDVRRTSINDGSISRPVVSGADWFGVYDNNTIFYTGESQDDKVAGVWRQGWDEPTVLAREPKVSDLSLHIVASKYFNEDTVAVSRGDAVSVYRGSLPSNQQALEIFTKSPKKFTLHRPIGSLQISSNGRFIIAEDHDAFVSYDLEHLSVSQEIKKYNDSPLEWMTSYHVWQVDDQGMLVMQEFDGMNSHALMPSSIGSDVVLTSDSRYIYSLVTNELDETELRQLSMTATK